MKFLIDECLSPELARIAHARGFGESMHVNWLGLNGEDDGAVLACAVTEGYVLVTNNSDDFLRRIEREEIHAGLVCLDMPDERKSKAIQIRLFEIAVDEIGRFEPLNEVLVVGSSATGLRSTDSAVLVDQTGACATCRVSLGVAGHRS